jgi:hypothetical protein
MTIYRSDSDVLLAFIARGHCKQGGAVGGSCCLRGAPGTAHLQVTKFPQTLGAFGTTQTLGPFGTTGNKLAVGSGAASTVPSSSFRLCMYNQRRDLAVLRDFAAHILLLGAI